MNISLAISSTSLEILSSLPVHRTSALSHPPSVHIIPQHFPWFKYWRLFILKLVPGNSFTSAKTLSAFGWRGSNVSHKNISQEQRRRPIYKKRNRLENFINIWHSSQDHVKTGDFRNKREDGRCPQKTGACRTGGLEHMKVSFSNTQYEKCLNAKSSLKQIQNAH